MSDYTCFLLLVAISIRVIESCISYSFSPTLSHPKGGNTGRQILDYTTCHRSNSLTTKSTNGSGLSRLRHFQHQSATLKMQEVDFIVQRFMGVVVPKEIISVACG